MNELGQELGQDKLVKENKLSPLEQEQLAIIKNILTRGLISASELSKSGTLRLTSKTSRSEFVDGILIRRIPKFLGLTDWEETGAIVKRRLYKDLWSVFGVIAERYDHLIDDASELPDEVLEDRFLNSMMIIMRAQDLELCQRGGGKDLKGVEGSISPDKFFRVLLPRKLEGTFRDQIINMTNVPVIGVPVKEEIVFGGHGLRCRKRLKVPDYEGELLRLLKKYHEPLFIHGVRLPTKDDEQYMRR